MVEDEAVLVFEHAHAQPELYGHAGLALADPLGVGLEDREDFLLVGNRLAQQDAAADLVDLALGVGQVDVEIDQRRGEYAAADSQGRAGISGTV